MTHSTNDKDTGVRTKIRLIRRIVLDGGARDVGSEHVVSWAEGRRLIGEGAAEPCDPDRFGRPTPYVEEASGAGGSDDGGGDAGRWRF